MVIATRNIPFHSPLLRQRLIKGTQILPDLAPPPPPRMGGRRGPRRPPRAMKPPRFGQDDTFGV